MARRLKLKPVSATPECRLVCCSCNRRGSSSAPGWAADPEGPAFQSYYCPDCVRAMKEDQA